MGLRFLHPVYAIPEVEISPTRHTSAQNIEKGKKWQCASYLIKKKTKQKQKQKTLKMFVNV